jgi:hypothetical protein
LPKRVDFPKEHGVFFQVWSRLKIVI